MTVTVVADSIETDHLTLDVSGSGDVSIGSLSAASLTVDINGSGVVEVVGQATS